MEIDDSEFLKWFHGLSKSQFMCKNDQVNRFFLEDSFNRTDLDEIFGISPTTIHKFIYFILYDTKIPGFGEDEATKLATDIYGLMHARYIFSPEGMKQIKAKYINGDFGKCPRERCRGERVLPLGEAGLYLSNVQVYCPNCRDIFYPSGKPLLDGAYFGPSLPAAFLMEYPSIVSPDNAIELWSHQAVVDSAVTSSTTKSSSEIS